VLKYYDENVNGFSVSLFQLPFLKIHHLQK